MRIKDTMRQAYNLNSNWTFRGCSGSVHHVDIPHTWNNQDGQDGGNDYWRGKCVYEKSFSAPEFGTDERVYLEFAGVNASAKVIVNGTVAMTHDGGYSTFRCDVTALLKDQNNLAV